MRLSVRELRCLAAVDVEPGEHNLIYGENASGKTSLLEAIFVLARGRSFRVAGRDGLIRDGQDRATISGRVRRDRRTAVLGLALERGKPARIRVDGRDQSSVAALAEELPVQVIDPGVHRLVDEGPGRRRRYLDWGLFHVKPDFLDLWRRYHRILKQRNAALKSGKPSVLESWDSQLVEVGEHLNDARRRYLAGLASEVESVCGGLLDGRVELAYRQGWTEGRTLAEALEQARERDLRHGATHPGPHRADIAIGFAAQPARGRVSRGQQKLLAAGLILAQLRHVHAISATRGVLLLDDMAAELDEDRLARLLNGVRALEVQLFVTALTPDAVTLSEPQRLFHVEQGEVTRVV